MGTDTARLTRSYRAYCPATDVSGLNVSEMKIYPNPATDLLFIETITPIDEVNIYNSTGSLVSQTKLPQRKGIDISQFMPGLYVAEIKTKAASMRRKWMKL